MRISPSILGVEGLELTNLLNTFKTESIEEIHLDVMDGNFVYNKSFLYEDALKVKELTDLPLDVHFMTVNPLDFIKEYSNISNLFTIHYEACSKIELDEIIKYCMDNNIRLGLSIKPNTDVSCIIRYLKYLDRVLVMSVEPGRGGQSFIESSLSKVSVLKTLKDEFNYSFKIEVDGGINNTNASKLKEHGADILVIGSYFSKANNDLIERIRLIKNI